MEGIQAPQVYDGGVRVPNASLKRFEPAYISVLEATVPFRLNLPSRFDAFLFDLREHLVKPPFLDTYCANCSKAVDPQTGRHCPTRAGITSFLTKGTTYIDANMVLQRVGPEPQFRQERDERDLARVSCSSYSPLV